VRNIKEISFIRKNIKKRGIGKAKNAYPERSEVLFKNVCPLKL